MRLIGPLTVAAIAGALTILVTGCAGSDGNLSPTRGDSGAIAAPAGMHPAWWREAPQSARAGVYVTQANGSTDGIVFGFRARESRDNPPTCSIANQNFDQSQIAADVAGNVYLPNIETGFIGVYGPNCGNLIGSVADPYGSAIDVTVHGGTFYAAGGSTVAACTMSGCASGLTDPSIFQLETAAADSKGNVWASFYNQKGAISLIVWLGGKMPGRLVTGYINENTPGALEFDNRDRLVSIQTLFFHAYRYRCSASRAACTNVGIFNLQAGSLFGALNARNTNIQVTDYANSSVDVYSYPGFAYRYSYERGFRPNYAVEGIVQTQ